MHYTIHGKVTLEGAIGLHVPVEALFLRVYDLSSWNEAVQQAHITEGHLWSEAELDALQSLPLAREPLSQDGTYEIDIDDRQHFYQGGKMLAILEVSYLPPMFGLEAAHPAAHLVAGLIAPDWQQDALVWRALGSDLSIMETAVEQVMDHFDVGCLSGVLLAQDSGLPMASVAVAACLGKVELGQGQTGQDGAYAIWFRGLHDAASIRLLVKDSHKVTQVDPRTLQSTSGGEGAGEVGWMGDHEIGAIRPPASDPENGWEIQSSPIMRRSPAILPVIMAPQFERSTLAQLGLIEPFFKMNLSYQPRSFPY
jgi:hypothetical protein